MIDFIMNLDYLVLMKIVGIDIMLGGDNAIVIALACMSLHPDVQNKAIALGTAGAVLARIFFLTIAGVLMGLPFIKLVAGLYLFHVAFTLLVQDEEDPEIAQKATLWGAVTTIVLADIGMSVDNVLAVSAASQSAGEHAMMYTIFGILISIPIIVYGSKLIIKLMEKFEFVIWVGGMLLGAVAVEMIITEPFVKEHLTSVEKYSIMYQLVGAMLVGLIAKLKLMKLLK